MSDILACLRRRWVLGLLMAGVTLAVYAPVRQFEFVNFDDGANVVENPMVRNGLTLEGLRWSFLSLRTVEYWRPLSFLTHMLDCEMYGLWAGGHHLTNVLLHAGVALALFLVLQEMTGALWRSAFVAAAFALHPLRVESVAWVTERKDVLSGLFFFLTIGAYVRYVRREWSPVRYGLVMVLFALGLMSKSMLVTLPGVLLLLDYWPLQRWSQVGGRQLMKEKVPFFVMAAISAGLTLLAQQGSATMSDVAQMSLGARLSNALVAYVAYLGKMLWPVDLAVLYPLKRVQSIWPGIGAAGVLLGVTAMVLWRMRRQPYLLVGWFWYLGILVPVIGLVQVGAQRMADRFTYLPSIGLLVLVAWGVAELVERSPWGRWAAGLAAGAVLGACGWLTAEQLPVWRNSITLFEHALATGEASPVAHNNLGKALAALGQSAAAIEHYREALRLKSDYPLAHNNLGNSLARQGQTTAAIEHYWTALQLMPDFPEAHYNLAVVLTEQGKSTPAIKRFEEALRLQPGQPDAHYYLANNLAMQNQTTAAIEHYREALRLQPDFPEARHNLALVLALQRRTQSEIETRRRSDKAR